MRFDRPQRSRRRTRHHLAERFQGQPARCQGPGCCRAWRGRPGAAAGKAAAEAAAENVAADRGAKTKAAGSRTRRTAAAGRRQGCRDRRVVRRQRVPAAAAMASAGSTANALAEPRGGKADKLILIKGIGPVNERKLNEHGIFHFDQIAAWKKADIVAAEAYLAFDGRIAREDWIGQAKKLAKEAAKPAPKKPEGLNNARQKPFSASRVSRPTTATFAR